MKDINRLVQIKSNNLKPKAGRLLISEPFMGDYYFGRSVVLLVEHNDEGSFGVVLNKLIEAPINDVLKGLPPFDSKIYLGGPVDTSSTFYIHSLGNKIEGSVEIGNGLYWGGDIEIIKEMILLNQLNSSNIRFFIGYSGWEANQLEGELESNSWIVSTDTNKSILNMPIKDMWKTILQNMGSIYNYWSKFPIDPGMN
ncbi:MAG: transcriptional regulator [Marinilabiliales bacterium]|nr:MAG: transcriptional regulator [Marinilabiliales bacterium]